MNRHDSSEATESGVYGLGVFTADRLVFRNMKLALTKHGS